MNLAYNNYGLSGQLPEDYDNFLCFSRKCKQRKAERHKARMERKASKTDARKADTERVRAETTVMQQTVSPTPPAPVATMPYTQQRITNPQAIASSGTANTQVPQTQKAGFGGNAIMIVVGLLLVGGYLVTKSKKGALVPGQPAPALVK